MNMRIRATASQSLETLRGLTIDFKTRYSKTIKDMYASSLLSPKDHKLHTLTPTNRASNVLNR